MYRRRLAAFAGAIGLLGALFSSGVAARADTVSGIDSTMSSLISTYLSSTQDACFTSSGMAVKGAGTCTITPAATPSGDKNIAVCVQSNSAGPSQVCSIIQDNTSHNNYTLVIQHIEQSQGAMQMAKQSVSIKQTSITSGSNFLAVFETINQSTHDQDSTGNQTQTNLQHVEATPFLANGPGLSQMSGTGSNFAEVTQDSTQSGKDALNETQGADQFAGDSGSGLGIKQTTTAPGANAATLSQIQTQGLNSAVASFQKETADQDGDITQSDGTGSNNLASGNQSQTQHEQAPIGATQIRIGGPKCCSAQIAGGHMLVTQATDQKGNALTGTQETIIANCDSPPNGCTAIQMATENGTTTPGLPCNGQSSCHQEISCSVEGCSTFPVGFGLLFSNPSLAIRAPVVTRIGGTPAGRSGWSVAILT
jgi:hypothetical protein